MLITFLNEFNIAHCNGSCKKEYTIMAKCKNKKDEIRNWYSKNAIQILNNIKQLISIKTNEYSACVNKSVLAVGAFWFREVLYLVNYEPIHFHYTKPK
ncbi:hypothetical protein BH11BAC3_BH11BAC3_16850 [soil metagenome]